jgi:hypothetical protein
MSKKTVANSAAIQVKPITPPSGGENECSAVQVERRDDDIILGGHKIPKARLREVCFDREDNNHFTVIAEIFNEGSGGFTRTAGVTDKIIGVVKENELPELKSSLDNLHITTLYLSR